MYLGVSGAFLYPPLDRITSTIVDAKNSGTLLLALR